MHEFSHWWQKWRTIFLSIFLAGYFFLCIAFLMPSTALKSRIFNPFVYQLWTGFGFQQNWKLFSPVVRDSNLRISAIVSYADGMPTIWEPDRMDRLDLWQRYRREKFRKWSQDCILAPEHRNFWPYIARYVARQCNFAGSPPEFVTLNHHWIEIPSADKPVEVQNLPWLSKFRTFFVYAVQKEDLQ